MKISSPIVATFDVTYKCNLECKICQTKWYCKDERFQTDLSKEQIINTARRLHEEEGLSIFRFIGAEPLLHPDIVEITQGVSKYGVTWITTNGTLLTEQLSEELIKAGLTFLFISFHTPNEHEDSATGDKVFEMTMDGIKAVDAVKKRLNSDLNVSIQLIVTPENYNKVLKFAKQFEAFDVSFCLSQIHAYRPFLKNVTWNGQSIQYLGDDSGDEGKNLNVWQKLVARFQYYLVVSRKKTFFIRPFYFLLTQSWSIFRELRANFVYTPCYRPYQHINIRGDGKIYACEFFRPAEMGDISDNKLWDTPLRAKLIAETSKGQYKICRQCNHDVQYRPLPFNLKK